MRPYESRVDPNRGNLETNTYSGRIPCEGRVWGDASTKPAKEGMPKIANKPAAGFTPTASEGTDPADTLILEFWPPEMWDTNFLWFKPYGLWYIVTATLHTDATSNYFSQPPCPDHICLLPTLSLIPLNPPALVLLWFPLHLLFPLTRITFSWICMTHARLTRGHLIINTFSNYPAWIRPPGPQFSLTPLLPFDTNFFILCVVYCLLPSLNTH